MAKFLIYFLVLAALPVLAAPPHKAAVPAPKKVILAWPTLKQTTRSFFVAEDAALQYLLRRQGFYQGKPDGVFGSQTERAVRAFQKARGVKVDGIAGPQTWQKLVVSIKRGDKGDAVRAVQAILREAEAENGEPLNPTMNTDGVFGAETQKAVRGWQEEFNTYADGPLLKADGIVGAQTWCVLVGGELKR